MWIDQKIARLLACFNRDDDVYKSDVKKKYTRGINFGKLVYFKIFSGFEARDMVDTKKPSYNVIINY